MISSISNQAAERRLGKDPPRKEETEKVSRQDDDPLPEEPELEEPTPPEETIPDRVRKKTNRAENRLEKKAARNASLKGITAEQARKPKSGNKPQCRLGTASGRG